MVTDSLYMSDDDIRECVAMWREEQSRARAAGDVARAMHAEKSAQRFEAYLMEKLPLVESDSQSPTT